MLNALWIVLLGMVITFAAMGVLLAFIVLLDRLTRTRQKDQQKG